MNRSFNGPPPPFVKRASSGQGGRFGRSGGRDFPPLPLPEKGSVRDFSSSRGRGGFALEGARRTIPVTDQDSIATEFKDIKPVAVPNETMLPAKGILKATAPAKVDGMVNGGSINSTEMNNGYGQFNGSNNEGMINGIGRESAKTVTFDSPPAVQVEINGGGNVEETGGAATDMGQQQSLVNGVGDHHVLLGQHNQKVVEGLAEIQRLAKSDDLAALKKLTVTLIRTLATAFNDFADALDKINSTTHTSGGH